MKTITSKKLSFKDCKQITCDYLSGMKTKDIAEKYDVPAQYIYNAVKKTSHTKTEIEKKNFEIIIARENARVASIKDKIYDFLEQGIEEAVMEDQKIPLFFQVINAFKELDKTFRLNNETATEIYKTDSVNKNIDINKLLEQMPTQEDRKSFLLQQLRR